MIDLLGRAKRTGAIPLILLLLALFAASSLAAASATSGPNEQDGPDFQGEHRGPPDLDARRGKKDPTPTQQAMVRARGARARWNRFGTPQSLITPGGYLATGLSLDPVAAAREWIGQNRELLRLSEQGAEELEVVNVAPIGPGHAVLLRQRFGDLPTGHDGLIAVAVVDGNIAYVSSSLTGDASLVGEPSISPQDAFRIAAANVGRSISPEDISDVREEDGWTVMTVEGFSDPQRARLVALPTPEEGVRAAYETLLLDDATEPFAFTHFVDAQTGAVLIREGLVDYADDNPTWRVFPASPPLDYSFADVRQLWCWEAAASCDRALANAAATVPWDIDAGTAISNQTTRGNAARGTENWFTNNPFSQGDNYATSSPTRDYTYPWTNQWFEERCNPDTTFTSPQRNDIDAAAANLFAMHNRMHDWSYFLGFTEQNFNLQEFNFGRGGRENDPEHGNAQAGGVSGGPPTFAARDNANQITPPDGIAATTNMYLWQPIAGSFYAPCVDGDFDMTVIGHEYTHAISNRMVAGPDARLSGAQANAMGESWSDLVAVEYLNEYGFVPLAGEDPFSVGPYVTRDFQAGIRNYGMDQSPLNYSNIGYDLVGVQVHADGEIWSATNFAIREALNARYGAGDAALQRRCADGELPADQCPGNRRWIQLVFDAWLLMAVGNVSMIDARDAMLAADVIRFGGANQDLLWNVFASRGLGENATSAGTNDPDPVPSFEWPFADVATVTFKAVGEAEAPIVAQLFVGDHEARSMPVADTDPATPLSDTVRLVPGTYEFLARADGYGMVRFSETLKRGQVRDLPVLMQVNLASKHNGATATGDGVNLDKLIDDTEATNWASRGQPVAGRQVTVRLDPSKPWYVIRRVQVSAMLRPPISGDPDPGGQNRFSALRQFEIWACEAKADIDCSQDAHFTLVYTSPPEAFPAIAPRPRAPELIMRSFEIPSTKATFVRLRVLTNQCTGAPDYQGEQDNDPRAATDCDEASSQGLNVRAAELQVFQK